MMSQHPAASPDPAEATQDEGGPAATPKLGWTKYPSTWGGAVYIVAAIATSVGMVLIGVGPWRWGTSVVGVAILVVSAARMVLPRPQAGMLEVRTRTFDVVCLIVVGVGIVFLALNIPDQPG